MATQAQIAANRRNSQKSTGPRTAAGKTASSQNALRHGLYAETVAIKDEDAAAFDDLQRDYFSSHNPQSPAETALVLELVRCDWLLRRTTTLETQLWNRALDDRREWLADNFDESVPLAIAYTQITDRLNLVQRRLSALSRQFHRALHDLAKLQSARPQPPDAPAPAMQPVSPIGFVPSNPEPLPPAAPSAAVSPTLGHFPQSELLKTSAIRPQVQQNTATETFRPFGPLRAYTPPETCTRKGTL